jgi:ATP-dependent Clp protease ATP-binding subunit ClpA
MFDELDKAHPEVLKVFMSILDEGRCTARQEDSQGSRELDFRRCIFLFTTNTDLSGARRLGFAPAQPPPAGSGPAASLTGGPADLARQLFQSDETARQALARSGVLREITGRFSGLVGFQPLDEPARVAITAKQITALAREYGLNVVQTAPHLARALTPRQAVSPRSSVPMLEGVLSPVFLACPPSAREQALCLSGSVEHMYLAPVQT